MKDDNVNWALIGKWSAGAFTLLLIPARVIVQGWMVQTMWGWFITPSLHVDAPSVMLCFGLRLMFGYCTWKIDPYDDTQRKKHSPWILIATEATATLMVLSCAFIVHLLT